MKKFTLISENRGQELESDNLKEIYEMLKRCKVDDKEHNISDSYYVEKNTCLGGITYESSEVRVYRYRGKILYKEV